MTQRQLSLAEFRALRKKDPVAAADTLYREGLELQREGLHLPLDNLEPISEGTALLCGLKATQPGAPS